jgi:hypothetical protein
VTFLLALILATTITGKTTEPFQTWTNQAAVPTPSGEVRVVLYENACAGYDCSVPWAKPPRIILFNVFDHWTRFEFLHELGHVYSYQHREIRKPFARLLELRRYDDEQFAMAYSWCATRTFRAYPGYGYWPTRAQSRSVCALIRRSA